MTLAMSRRSSHKSDPIFKKLYRLEDLLKRNALTEKQRKTVEELLEENVRPPLIASGIPTDAIEAAFQRVARWVTPHPRDPASKQGALDAIDDLWVTFRKLGRTQPPRSFRDWRPLPMNPDEEEPERDPVALQDYATSQDERVRPLGPHLKPIRDSLALAIIELQKEHGNWKGTMAELLAILQPKGKGDPAWPTTPHKLTRCITKVEPLLASRGVTVTKLGRAKKGNIFLITSSTAGAELQHFEETLAR